MMPEFSLPGAPKIVPGLPANQELFEFKAYRSLNTKPTRPAVEEPDMAWTQNFQPLGEQNLRAMWDVGAAIYTTGGGGGTSITFFAAGNIADTQYQFAFLSNGSIQAVNLTSLAVTQVAAASTITVPTNAIGLSQWGSQYILIIAPQTNGYFIWDGTLFYQAGGLSPIVNIISDGEGYTGVPAIRVLGGSGIGATVSATIQNGSLLTITVTNPGTGYVAGDVPYLAFSGGGSNATATAHASIANGVVTAVTVDSAGTGYSQSSIKVTIEGGQGFGATATATVSGGTVTAISGSGGEGYVNPPSVIITDPNNAVAQATLTIMPFGVQGTDLEVYTSRVWIVNGSAPSTPPPKNLVQFTAPGTVADFSPADGAGAFTATNSFLRVGYHSIKQSNGFLYLIGDSAVDYISGVQTQGSPPITTFTNQNIDPQVGSPYPNTVQVFSRDIMSANSFGIHAIRGGAVPKVSEALDGVYPSVGVANFGSFVPSATVAVMNGIHVYGLLWPIINPYTGLQENMLLMCQQLGNRLVWFTADQSVSLTFVNAQEYNSQITAYGTDGNSIYPLFQTASANITKVVRSKFWGNPGYFSQIKVMNVYGLVEPVGTTPAIVNVNVDTENGTVVIPNANSTIVQWINNDGSIVQWTNNSGNTVQWVNSGTLWFQQPTNAYGNLVGMTLTSTSLDLVLVSLSMLARTYDLET
jgi:hypothetical protein